MAITYKRLIESDTILWNTDSPAEIEKLQVSLHSVYGVNVLQLTFRNVGEYLIYDMSILITLLDGKGRYLDEDPVEYNYYGMEAEPGKTFGANEDIVIPDEAKAFEITITRIVMEQDQIVDGEILLEDFNKNARSIDELLEFYDSFMEVLAQTNPKLHPEYIPEQKAAYWRCGCGRDFPNTMKRCPVCKISRTVYTNIYPDLLEEKRQLEARIAAEEAAQLEADEKARKQAEAEREAAEKAEAERQAALEAERLAYEEQILAEQEERERAAELARIQAEQAEQERQIRKRKRIVRSIVAAAVIVIAVGGIFLIRRITRERTQYVEVPVETTVEVPVEVPVFVEEDDEVYGQTIACMGEDLTAEDRRIVLRLIGGTEEDLEKCLVINVGKETGFTGSGYISCVMVTPTAPGSGIKIELYNITEYTEDDYIQALNDAGITDARVYVAAPSKATGYSAFAGIQVAGQYFDYLKSQETTDTDTADTKTDTKTGTETEE